MRTFAVLGLLGAVATATAEPLHFSSGTAHVALIELYTSEGCSSCPPADQWLGSLADKPGLWKEFVPVEFHVNYWDSLGWRDRLSTRDFTARQYAYSAAWGSSNVYTPCFVRDGAEWRPLSGESGVPGTPLGTLSVDVEGGSCSVEFVPGFGAPATGGAFDVHVALLGGGISSKVTAGENGGRTLTHEFVVLGMAQSGLSPDTAGTGLRATVALPIPVVPDAKHRALAAWVTRHGGLVPVQAAGGWLP
jgi:hypothetical protein